MEIVWISPETIIWWNKRMPGFTDEQKILLANSGRIEEEITTHYGDDSNVFAKKSLRLKIMDYSIPLIPDIEGIIFKWK